LGREIVRMAKSKKTKQELAVIKTPQGDEADFYRQVADLLAAARQHAKRQ